MLACMYSNSSCDDSLLCPYFVFLYSWMLNRLFFPFVLFVKSQMRCILLSLPLKQNSYSEASESWLFMSSDKFKTIFLDRNIFSYSISIFFPEIKITERNKFTICLKTPLFCSWSCNFYRICICSGCVRAPVESLYVVPIHVSAHGSWG